MESLGGWELLRWDVAGGQTVIRVRDAVLYSMTGGLASGNGTHFQRELFLSGEELDGRPEAD